MVIGGGAPSGLCVKSFCQKGPDVPVAASQLTAHPGNAANRRGLGTRLITIIASSVTIPARAWHSRLLPVIRTPDIEFIIQWPRA